MPSLLSILLLFPILTLATDFKCSRDTGNSHKIHALPLKLAAMFSILVSGAVGVCVPVVGQHVPSLGPERDLFFIIKAFAAGVILATGFVHILPDAYDYLMSPCLPRSWGEFPFAGFIAMLTAIGTLIGETVTTGYINRAHAKKLRRVVVDQQTAMDGDRAYAHGSATAQEGGVQDHADLIRRRIISQVLEIGIIVHSVIIGISLGASQSPSTIKPLVVALSFHQFFEGMGLGGSIVQAKFKKCSTVTMVIFFSLTNPIGITTGIGISFVYNVHSPTALIVEGILNSAAAGILIYMALVDLLAADFMNPRVQSKGKLQLLLYISLLAGAGLMSLLAKWT